MGLNYQLNNKMNMFFKKGQVGLTLTWFVAFIVIFFIMILFIAMSSILSLKKAIPFFGEGFSEIEIYSGKNLGSLENQNKLIYLLNSPINGNKDLKHLLVESKISGNRDFDSAIKNEAEIILEDITEESDCYYFKIDYGSGREDILISKQNTFGYVDVWNLQRTSKLDFFYDKEKINTALYIGECL